MLLTNEAAMELGVVGLLEKLFHLADGSGGDSRAGDIARRLLRSLDEGSKTLSQGRLARRLLALPRFGLLRLRLPFLRACTSARLSLTATSGHVGLSVREPVRRGVAPVATFSRAFVHTNFSLNNIIRRLGKYQP
jgi:hypothetical protein